MLRKLLVVVGLAALVATVALAGDFVPFFERTGDIKDLVIGDPGCWSVFDECLPDGQHAGDGFGIRLVGAILTLRPDYGLGVVPTTWGSVAQDVVAGAFDTTFSPVFITPERDELADFVPYACFSTVSAVVRVGEVRFGSSDELQPARVATVTGYATDEWLRTNGYSAVTRYADQSLALKALLTGAVDVLMIDLRSALDEIALQAVSSLVEVRFEALAGYAPGGFIVNPADPAFKEFLGAHVRALAGAGVLQQIAKETGAVEVLAAFKTFEQYAAGAPVELPDCGQ